MTYLLAKEQRLDMLELYHKASQLMAVIIFSVSGILICFPSALLYAWTGNAALVNWGSSILVWYVLVNGILTITSFQYYLQYAHGKLRLHVAFNTTLAIIMIPLVLFAAYHFGAIGTAVSWGLIQLLIFLIYPIFVHRQFAPGIHLRWLFKDILPILISTILLCFTIRQIPISFLTLPRLEIFILLCGFGLLILGVNALVSDACRHQLWAIFKSIKGK
jgi:O-antigen/teichoic acid export membrane protein